MKINEFATFFFMFLLFITLNGCNKTQVLYDSHLPNETAMIVDEFPSNINGVFQTDIDISSLFNNSEGTITKIEIKHITPSIIRCNFRDNTDEIKEIITIDLKNNMMYCSEALSGLDNKKIVLRQEGSIYYLNYSSKFNGVVYWQAIVIDFSRPDIIKLVLPVYDKNFYDMNSSYYNLIYNLTNDKIRLREEMKKTDWGDLYRLIIENNGKNINVLLDDRELLLTMFLKK